MQTLLKALLVFLLGLFASSGCTEEKSLGESAKIEALIAAVEKLEGAQFDRNGSEYDAKTAARFLRGKWNANKDEIKTAADFIEKAATASGSSGKPYLIKFKDGSQKKCADYLKEELAKLNAPGSKEKP